MDVGQQSGNLRDSRPRRPPPKRASERHEQTQVLRARTERFRMWSIVESTQKKDPPKGLWTSVGGGEKFTGARSEERRVGKECRDRGGGDHEKKKMRGKACQGVEKWQVEKEI